MLHVPYITCTVEHACPVHAARPDSYLAHDIRWADWRGSVGVVALKSTGPRRRVHRSASLVRAAYRRLTSCRLRPAAAAARPVIAQATPPCPVICMETESPVICMFPVISSVYLMTKGRNATTNGVCADNPVQCTGVEPYPPQHRRFDSLHVSTVRPRSYRTTRSRPG